MMSKVAVLPRRSSASSGHLDEYSTGQASLINASPAYDRRSRTEQSPCSPVNGHARSQHSPSADKVTPPQSSLPSSSSTTADRKRMMPMSPRQRQQMTEETSTSVPMPLSEDRDAGKEHSYLYPLAAHLNADQTRTSSYPSTPPRDFLQYDPHPGQHDVLVNRTQSLRVPTRSSSGDDCNLSRSATWRLPSHNREGMVNEEMQYNGKQPATPKSNRRLMSPSASMSLLASPSVHNTTSSSSASPFQPSTLQSRSSWSRNARRWSSSLPRGRDSAAFAFRLAEGASPYLRAGLEELRSIFDVDSNPIPSSPFIEDFEDDDEGYPKRNSTNSEGEEGSASTARHSATFLSIDGGNGTMTSSPGALSSREASPSRSSVTLRRTPSDERQQGSLQTRPDDRSASWAKSKGGYFATPIRPSLHYRGESMMPDELRPRPYNNRQFLACSLCVIAVGLTALSAWGYAMQSDTFSITLIGFFLTQPAFALAALASLLLRKRTWMDLCSRAIRAHVLAQALIVILAYLDLSASSSYVSPSRGMADSADQPDLRLNRPLRGRFSMVPSMEMRFGPLYGAREAADGPAASSGPALMADGSEWSIHAHDSSVGDWRSRLTHLIVFLVQAAVPILMVLVGQYIVAQRLAWLARQGGLSRQSSLRQQQQEGAPLKSPPMESHQYVPGAGLRAAVPRLDVPSPQSVRRDLPPLLRLPGGGGVDSTRSMRQDQQRRRRLATSSGIPEHLSLSPQTTEKHVETAIADDRHVMTPSHKHNRSASQPVNLSELASKADFATMTPSSSSGGSSSHGGITMYGEGLGVTLAPDTR